MSLQHSKKKTLRPIDYSQDRPYYIGYGLTFDRIYPVISLVIYVNNRVLSSATHPLYLPSEAISLRRKAKRLICPAYSFNISNVFCVCSAFQRILCRCLNCVEGRLDIALGKVVWTKVFELFPSLRSSFSPSDDRISSGHPLAFEFF